MANKTGTRRGRNPTVAGYRFNLERDAAQARPWCWSFDFRGEATVVSRNRFYSRADAIKNARQVGRALYIEANEQYGGDFDTVNAKKIVDGLRGFGIMRAEQNGKMKFHSINHVSQRGRSGLLPALFPGRLRGVSILPPRRARAVFAGLEEDTH